VHPCRARDGGGCPCASTTHTRRGNATTPPSGRRRAPVAPIVLVTVAILVPLGVGWWRAQHADTCPLAPSPSATATRPPVSTAATAPGVQPRKGRWLRTDGGYVIDVRTVAEGGTMAVAYVNPRPIAVSKAAATQEGATTQVVLESRDVQYPGSTSTRTDDPVRDQRQGVSVQAAPQQRVAVVFVRMPCTARALPRRRGGPRTGRHTPLRSASRRCGPGCHMASGDL
jgi:hypothetical protein